LSQILKPKKGYKKVKWWFGKTIEIPKEWEDRKIDELIKFEGGSQPPRIDFVFQPTEGYVRMIQIRDFKTDRYQTYIPNNSTQKFFKKDDVMIGRYGPPNFQILRGLEGAYNVALMKVVPKEGIEKDYLYYFLKQEKIFDIIDSLAKRTAGQDGVELDILRRLPFPLPPKEERKKIITILSNVDELITSTQKIIIQTKSIKKGLMQKLLIRGIGHTKFKKVTMGLRYMIEEYPEGWEITTLGKKCKLERGKFSHRPRDDPEYYGGKYPFIQTGDVEKSNGYISTFSQTLNENGLKVSKIFPKGIIVITIAAIIGTTSITTFPVCFPDSLIGISTDVMDIQFLEYYLRTRKKYLNVVATVSAQKYQL